MGSLFIKVTILGSCLKQAYIDIFGSNNTKTEESGKCEVLKLPT